MSTSASPSTPLTPLQQPFSMDQARPPVSRSTSLSVTPKSEYLRNALQARRANVTSPASPFDIRPMPPPAMKLPKILTPDTTPDIFAEFALSEEQTTPVSPIRRRRPSDVGLPRSKTNRELTIEVERLKDTLITSNMRVELLKKNNSQLQHDLTKAKEQIEDLEPLEQENRDLREENGCLRLKAEDMSEEIEHLRDSNDLIRKANDEISTLAEESASHWQDQEYAIDEAAECIIKLEEEKSGIAAELLRLKERLAALEGISHTNTLLDGSPGRYPSRMYSIDESRPSTSHFDSDYYSLPASPYIKASGDSMISITASERTKKFLDLNVERRQSARDLSKRISAASLQALSIRPSCPVPKVPQIPIAYQQQAARLVKEGTPEAASMSPGRYRTGQQLISESLLDLARAPSVCSDGAVPRAPTPHSEGLRGLYNPNRPLNRKPINDSYPSSPRTLNSTNATSPTESQPLNVDTSPLVLSRSSSRHSRTKSSIDHLQLRSPRHERQSDSKMYFDDTYRPVTNVPSSQWESLAPPPCVSVVSEVASELDSGEDRDRWWRSMDKLTFSQVLAQSQPFPTQHALQSPPTQQITTLQPPPTQRTLQPPPHTTPAKASSPWQNDSYVSIRPSRSGDKIVKTESSIAEKDFFFNRAEDEDTFVRKATAWIGVGRR